MAEEGRMQWLKRLFLAAWLRVRRPAPATKVTVTIQCDTKLAQEQLARMQAILRQMRQGVV